MNGQVEGIKNAWAWVASLGLTTGGLAWGQHALTFLGLVIALLTIVERIYAIRVKRKEREIQDAQLRRLEKY